MLLLKLRKAENKISMTKFFSLWSCKDQTLESIIPEEGLKRWEEAGIDSCS